MTLLTRPKKTVGTVVIATDGSGDYNCNGTDDDITINAALNSLPVTGGCMYLKEGTYIITSTILFPTDNITIFGCGASTRIVTNDNITMISGDGLEHIGIHDIYVYGAGAGANNHGIVWDKILESTITKIWVENCGGDGIQFLGDIDGIFSSKCSIINNVIKGNGGNGIKISIT